MKTYRFLEAEVMLDNEFVPVPGASHTQPKPTLDKEDEIDPWEVDFYICLYHLL